MNNLQFQMKQNISAFVQEKCRSYADLTFIHDSSGRNIAYSEFWKGVLYASGQLRNLGITANTRFSIAMPNSAEFLYLLFGGILQNGIAVNLNPLMSADEFDYRFENAGVEILFTTQTVALKLEQVLLKRSIKCVMISGAIDELKMKESDGASFEVLDLNQMDSPDDLDMPLKDNLSDLVSFFQYTGGTTGNIKAAMISHGNILSSVGQMSSYLSARLKENEETFMVTFPFYHVFSIVFQVLTAMKLGSRIIIYPNARDLPLLSKLMQHIPFTVFVGVHTLYKWMLQDPVLSTMKYPSAKIFIAGAEHIQPETKIQWKEGTDHLIVEGYGLTETSALATMSALDPGENDIDGIGIPLPGTEIKLIGAQDIPIQETEREGEICIRGPQVVKGYWNNPEDNASTFIDGWLRTGDMGIRKPNGQYKIVGRKKDMINVSGFNVYPSEVESVIMRYPGVSECAVTGVPNEKSGERVAAFIISDSVLDGKDIIQFCSERLSAYKVPVSVHFPESIPKSAVGKTLRRSLRALLR